MSYSLSLNGVVLYGYKREHKKSGLWRYDKLISAPHANDYCIKLEFDTKYQAQLWLLQVSSFPKFSEFLTSPGLTEEIVEKMYLKGKYRLASRFIRSLKHQKIVDSQAKETPYLCEIIIHEE